MSVRFKWKWVTDDSGEHVRVVVLNDEQPEGVEVCRMVPGRTDDDRSGCVLRAVQVCEAVKQLAKVTTDANTQPRSGATNATS